MPNDQSVVVDDHRASAHEVLPLIVEAWAANDADAFADAFTEDASLILPGVYLTSRDEIRSFMADAFAGPYRGTRVYGQPLSLRHLDGGTTVIVTRGGVLAPGESEVAPERTIRATWVIAFTGGRWRIAAYQNTPVHTD